jgi:penicillin-binding protein 2
MSFIATAPERFAGVVFTERTRRRYPERATAAHIIGYVGPLQRPAREDILGEYERLEQSGYFRASLSGEISDDDYETLETRGDFRADVLGRAGIEKTFEGALAGRRGWRIVERDLISRKETEVYKSPPIPGTDVCLTIDMALQKHVESVLKLATKPAVGIVLEVETSDVLALASTPAYEPGALQSPVSPETVRAVLHDNVGRPLFNRAISDRYMLGSIFKIVTTISALEKKAIDPKTEFECSGQFRENVKGFRCWIAAPDIGGSHGALSLREAMTVSCNIFFLETGNRVGGKTLSSWASMLGFGRVTGIELPGEVPGILPTPADPIVGEHWSDVDTWNLSIGQGALAVTPLQVAQLLALVGRDPDNNAGGVSLAAPRLVSRLIEHPGRALAGRDGREALLPALISMGSPLTGLPRLWSRQEQFGRVVWLRKGETDKLTIAGHTLVTLRDALFAVVNDSIGTAHKSGLAEVGDVAGKTSTAEVSKTGTPAPHAWFAGYYPASAPKFAFVVLVVNGGKGSEAAAPLAARIVEYLKTMAK